jgi:hypothetical protein
MPFAYLDLIYLLLQFVDLPPQRLKLVHIKRAPHPSGLFQPYPPARWRARRGCAAS